MAAEPLIFQFDDVRVDSRNALILKAGKPASVEPKAFQVLVYLIENRGRLIEKDELLSHIWRDTFVTENALTREIALLRRVLGDNKADAKYIETVPTRGYRFIAEVSVEAPAASVSPGAPNAAPNLLKPALMLGGIAVLAVLLYLVARPFIGSKSTGAPLGLQAMQVTSSAGMDIFPSFSPDGSSIAYSSDSSGSFEIYLKQLMPGGRIIQLTNDGARNLQPAWSPDGRTIAYYSQAKGGIWVMPALGGVARQLTSFGSAPGWSPDGTEIAFQSDGLYDLEASAGVSVADSTIWIVSVRGGEPRQVTQTGKPLGAHNSPSWSPDGRHVVFVTFRFGAEPALWTVTPDGKELKSIDCCGELGRIYNPVYSRDGTSLYVSANTMTSANTDIWKLSLAKQPKSLAGAAVKIFGSPPTIARYLAVSSDGRKIAYSAASTISNLYSLPISPASNEAIGPPRALTSDTRYRKTEPAFSADGRQIAFVVCCSGPEDGAWVMDANGENSTLVSDRCDSPQWLPDGKNLACLEGDADGFGLWRHNLATGKDERLRNLPEDAAHLSVTRDGMRATFTSQVSGTPNGWVVPLAGGESRQVTFDPESMAFSSWSPDGKFLALEMKRGGNTYLVIVPASGGRPIQLTFAPGQSWVHSWAPDGDKIVFAGLRNGIWNIWWVSRSTKIENQATQYTRPNIFIRYPAWSPAGNQIVYEYGETTANIWMLDLK